MHLTQSLLLSAFISSSVLAATNTTTTTHVVRVGSTTNNTVKYFPDNIKANVGDIIQFQFASGNHTVTQSTFDAPCVPISQSTNSTGVFSGFMDVTAANSTGMVPVFSMPVKVKTPLWFYCSQAKHCQKGMVLVVNENTAANATRSLANFAALAAKAPANLYPTLNGTASSSSSSSTSGTSNSSSSSSGLSSSGSGSGSESESGSGSDSSSTATALSPSASSSTSSSNSGESSASASETTSSGTALATANAGARLAVHNVAGYMGI
ncbi:hypothetical protein EYC84_002923 [Monilinia fructicola]|uniref:Phytocyanin domain-containing protein n=1 Tax=Monilinia fructicola TaxID=38448 RepID=A0A5M9JUD3_MONFR|nr:hypothetical protein EYC84_002923 [Monilinia fructicola]